MLAAFFIEGTSKNLDFGQFVEAKQLILLKPFFKFEVFRSALSSFLIELVSQRQRCE